MEYKSFEIKKEKIKLPILNNHTSKGLYNFQWLPEHYAWISHLILGLLSIKYPMILPMFVIYQVSQMVMKKEYWDDVVDLLEFYIGRLYLIKFFQ